MKQSLAPVISSTEVITGVRFLWLEASEIAAAAKPGQFVMVRCGEDTVLRRPLSIHQVDETKTRLALLFAVVGKGTDWLSGRQAGDKVDIFGPLGNGFSFAPGSHNVLLVAGGMGIAPLSFLAKVARAQGCAVKLHQGVYSECQVLLEPLRDHYTLVADVQVKSRYATPQFPQPSTLDCSASTVSASSWPTGLATTYIPGYAAWADQIFACGPMPMYKTMAQMPELKNKPVQISLEMRMACGFGVCYGCTVKTRSGLKQVCKDGPVFDLRDIMWGELGC